MSTPAPAELMRLETMVQWLMQCGLTRSEIRRSVTKGIIHGRTIRPGGRIWYSASQIERDVLNGWEEAQRH